MATFTKNLLGSIRDWWNPPCTKHHGHREREVDTDLHFPMLGGLPSYMCAECADELEEKLLRPPQGLQ